MCRLCGSYTEPAVPGTGRKEEWVCSLCAEYWVCGACLSRAIGMILGTGARARRGGLGKMLGTLTDTVKIGRSLTASEQVSIQNVVIGSAGNNTTVCSVMFPAESAHRWLSLISNKSNAQTESNGAHWQAGGLTYEVNASTPRHGTSQTMHFEAPCVRQFLSCRSWS